MTDVHMDPRELRRVAERILGDHEFDYKPALNDIRRKLQPDLDVMAKPKSGFIYGDGGIGQDHDSCMVNVVQMFNNIERGFVAVSNVLASVSEDFAETDLDSDTNIKAIFKYFTQPEPGNTPR